jgi:hypothetical protein
MAAARGKDVSHLIQTLTDEATWNSMLELSEEKLISKLVIDYTLS